MKEIMLFALFAVCVAVGMFFLIVGVFRIIFADRHQYNEAQRLSGGIKKVWLGEVNDTSDAESHLVTKGIVLRERSDGKYEWRSQRKLSPSALMHWRRL